MITEREFDNLTLPIIQMYSEIELELLRLIAERFNVYDPITGSMEWWIHKLEELGGLNQDAIKIISAYSGKTEQEIIKMLNEVGYKSIDHEEIDNLFRNGITNLNPEAISITDVIENSYRELNQTFRLVKTRALESVKEEYIKVINTAYLEVSSGIYDGETAIRKGLRKMADSGISGATYRRRDGTLVSISVEAVIRRDVITAVHQTANRANEKVASDVGAEYYIVSEHLGARNTGEGHQNHESWQGKIFKINGSDEYPNFEETTGYGLVDGLSGVNCRHLFWFFFPGISVMPKSIVNEKENSRVYELTKRQRELERRVRDSKKRVDVAERSNDTEEEKKANAFLRQRQKELKEYVRAHPELRRQSGREQIG